MDMLKSLFEASPISALFVCLAVGYSVGKIRIGNFELGGIPGTLFVSILVGQIGVEVDENIKTMAFALFIYTLGYGCGPQFFSSLGRSTLNQVHLAIFSAAVVFLTVWGVSRVFGLDPGTAAGLLAGATSESAAVGTAGEALKQLGLDAAGVQVLQSNIAVTYAVTYLFGFTLVIVFVTVVAPWLLGIKLKEAARDYEAELGDAGDPLDPGQEEGLRDVMARVYRVLEDAAVGTTVGELEDRLRGEMHVLSVLRRKRLEDAVPELVLAKGDRVTLMGRREAVVEAGAYLGEETSNVEGLEFVRDTKDVLFTRRDLAGITYAGVRKRIDRELRRGVFTTRLMRGGQEIQLRPGTRLLAGDVLTLCGPAEMVTKAAAEIGYLVDDGLGVDYAYLGLGIISGILLGMVRVPIAGMDVALHTGGGCLLSGLVFGWLRSKRPTFGSMPAATAIHLRDFGLAVFIASVGLASGPQAVALLSEKGVLLPVLSVVVVLVPLLSSMYYARYVLKLDPILICGALAGLLTCTAALNAAVAEAESDAPVLGYTVPYAIANVLLTMLGPVIVFTV